MPKAFILLIVLTLLFFISCAKSKPESSESDTRKIKPANQEDVYHADHLLIDSRYSRAIEFEKINCIIPLADDKSYFRDDGAVEDVKMHQQEVLQELSISDYRVYMTNEAKNGRQMFLKFKDGKKCAFIWALNDKDSRLVISRLNHEKYHVLCRMNPEGVLLLQQHIQKLGFSVNFKEYDEELSATIIEILTIHLSGTALEEIGGSQLVIEARNILNMK
jgi:hypothetical protein